MASETTPTTSFSASRRWAIFFSVIISIAAVFALVVMANYLSARYYRRMFWSTQANDQLSSQTVSLLNSVTNQVKVVIYYDADADLYDSVTALLDEYHLTNPKISVQKVNYRTDPVTATQIKATYKLGDNKDLVIFECDDRVKIIPSSLLVDYSLKRVPNETKPEYEREIQFFEGEKWFSAAILSVINPKPLNACFLQGDGEHPVRTSGDNSYQKFAEILAQNNIQSSAIQLIGTNTIPADCNLLIIAGPTLVLPPEELDKIRQYLKQGGRLFILFNWRTRHLATGLESLLAEWNVDVGMNVISDPENTMTGGALSVANFRPKHPLTDKLAGAGLSLALVYPRSITPSSQAKQDPEAPTVVALAATGANARVGKEPGGESAPTGGQVSLMVAVNKGTIKGVLQERGSTAILVVGDSDFLSNYAIDAAANRDFAGFAVNWLLDETQLLQGVGPHPVKEYKLIMTRGQINSVRWLLLAAMPGGILLFGGIVWFQRRH